MSQTEYTRRDLLRTSAGAAGAAALAGCGGILGGNGDGGDPAGDVVPAQASMVAYIDIQGLVADENLRSIGDAYLGELATMDGYQGPETVEEAIQQAEQEAQNESQSDQLQSDSFETMTFFADVENMQGSEPYAGAAVSTSLSESDFQDLLNESEGGYDEEEYNGITIYTDTGSSDTEEVVAWLGDGRMALASRSVVEDIVDVYQGDADGMTGDLKTQYDGVNEGYMRFATKLPEGTIPEDGGGEQFDLDPFRNIQYLSGNFVSGGSTVTLTVNHHTGSSDEAQELSDVVESFITLGGQMTGDGDMAQEVLDTIEVSTDGSTVITGYEEDVSTLEGYAEELAGGMMGPGMGAGT